MKNDIKYEVSIITATWKKSSEGGFNWQQKIKEFKDENPLIARENAFKEKDNLEEFFDSEGLEIIHIPLGTSPKSKDIEYRTYVISIHFYFPENQVIEIFNTYYIGQDFFLWNLEEEYLVLKDCGLNLQEFEETVYYYDGLAKKNKTTIILPNGMNWKDYVADDISAEDIEKFTGSKGEKAKKNKTSKKRNKVQSPINIALKKGECNTVEFKSTLKFNLHTSKQDPGVEFEVSQAIAAFINTEGGVVLIGVDDNANVLGLENDFTLCRNLEDVFQRSYDNIIKKSFDNYGKISVLIQADFYTIKKKKIFMVNVNKSDSGPVFIKDVEKGNELSFVIRSNSSSRRLDVKEAISYILTKWPKYRG